MHLRQRQNLARVEAVADNLAEGPRDDHGARVEEDLGTRGPLAGPRAGCDTSRRSVLQLAANGSTQLIMLVSEKVIHATQNFSTV